MEIYKIVFNALVHGSHEIHTLYINHLELIVESNFAAHNDRQYQYHKLHDKVLNTVDKVGHITQQQISMSGDQWQAFPPLSIDDKEIVKKKEIIEDRLYVSTETTFNRHEYELAKFPIVLFPNMTKFFNPAFDQQYTLVWQRRDFNKKGQLLGEQSIKSIEIITALQFELVLSKFM